LLLSFSFSLDYFVKRNVIIAGKGEVIKLFKRRGERKPPNLWRIVIRDIGLLNTEKVGGIPAHE